MKSGFRPNLFWNALFLLFTMIPAIDSVAGQKIVSKSTKISVVPPIATPGAGWTQISKSNLQSVCPPNNFGGQNYAFFDNCRGVVNAWSSGIMDTKRNRMIVWGGGHNDYYGNEVYAVNLNSNTIERLNDPGTPLWPRDGSYGGTAIAGGTQPNGRHTYDGISYVENADKMLVVGGCFSGVNGAFGNDFWSFDFPSMKWTKLSPNGTLPTVGPGFVTAYDPTLGKVFIHDSNQLFLYDVSSNKIEVVSSNVPIDYHLVGTIDPVKKKLVLVGSGSVFVYNISGSPPYSRQLLTTSGASALVGSGYPGLAYNSAIGKIVGWNGGNTAYELDLDSGIWKAHTALGGPGAAQGTGTYKRFSYSKTLDAFVVVNDMNQNAFLLKLGN